MKFNKPEMKSVINGEVYCENPNDIDDVFMYREYLRYGANLMQTPNPVTRKIFRDALKSLILNTLTSVNTSESIRKILIENIWNNIDNIITDISLYAMQYFETQEPYKPGFLKIIEGHVYDLLSNYDYNRISKEYKDIIRFIYLGIEKLLVNNG